MNTVAAINKVLRRLDTPADVAARERRRIRRAIVPLKLIMWSAVGNLRAAARAEAADALEGAIHSLDAATRAPRKVKR